VQAVSNTAPTTGIIFNVARPREKTAQDECFTSVEELHSTGIWLVRGWLLSSPQDALELSAQPSEPPGVFMCAKG
jgi:hypothetical protein